MLAYILALAVGLGSLALYMAAFFFPEVHRKSDFIWSGVGLFYALVLWVCAGRITGGLVLGQTASVALLGWLGWQTLTLRRQLTPAQQQTEVPSAQQVKTTVGAKISNLSLGEKLSGVVQQLSSSISGAKNSIQQKVTKATASKTDAIPNKPAVEIVDNRTSIPQPAVSSEPTVDEDLNGIPQPTKDTTTEPPYPVAPLVQDTTIEPPYPVAPPTQDAVEASPVAPPVAEAETDSSTLVRPNPPDPELVEAAIRDAEEKDVQAAPPPVDEPENPSPS